MNEKDSAAYWRQRAERLEQEALLYRGMVGQMHIALRQLTEIWEAESQAFHVRSPAMAEAFAAVRATLAIAKARP
jgi:hypothetical protein